MCAIPVWTFFLTFRLAPFFCMILLLGRRLLLAGHGLARALSGPCVGVRSLPTNRQAAAVAQTPVAADVHQQLDVLSDLAAQVALHLVVALDRLAQSNDVALGKLVRS